MIDAAERMRSWVLFFLDAIDLGLTNDQARVEANELILAMDRAMQSEEEECVTD
jgi:hypothetical protein